MSLKIRQACLALFSACLAIPASAAPADDSPTVIAVAPYLGVIWSLEASLNGKTQTFLFDTAGGLSVITPATAREIGCEPWGRVTGFRMRGDRVDEKRCDGLTFQVGDAALKAPTVGVWDFANILPKDAPPIGGLIALDSFAGKVVTLDLAHRQIVIETPKSFEARRAAGTKVDLILSREAQGLALTPFVAVETARGKVWMELDSGSDAAVIVGDHNAPLFGMDPSLKTRQPLHAMLSGGVKLDTEAARVMPLILDGNIGAAILKQWVITLDLEHARAWIAPARP